MSENVDVTRFVTFGVLSSEGVASIEEKNKLTASGAGPVKVICKDVANSEPSLDLVVSNEAVHPVRLETLLVSSLQGNAAEIAGSVSNLQSSSATLKAVLNLSTRNATARVFPYVIFNDSATSYLSTGAKIDTPSKSLSKVSPEGSTSFTVQVPFNAPPRTGTGLLSSSWVKCGTPLVTDSPYVSVLEGSPAAPSTASATTTTRSTTLATEARTTASKAAPIPTVPPTETAPPTPTETVPPRVTIDISLLTSTQNVEVIQAQLAAKERAQAEMARNVIISVVVVIIIALIAACLIIACICIKKRRAKANKVAFAPSTMLVVDQQRVQNDYSSAKERAAEASSIQQNATALPADGEQNGPRRRSRRNNDTDPAFDPTAAPHIGKKRVGPPSNRDRSNRRPGRRVPSKEGDSKRSEELSPRSKRRQERRERRRAKQASKGKKEEEIAEITLTESKSAKAESPNPLSPRKGGWSLVRNAIDPKLKAKLKSKIIPHNKTKEDTISAADAVVAFTTKNSFKRKNRAAKARNAVTLEQFMERLHLSHYIQPMKDKLSVKTVAQLSSVKLEQLRRIGMNGIVCSRVLLAIAGIRDQQHQAGDDMQARLQLASLHGPSQQDELLSPRSVRSRTLQLSDDEEDQAKAKEIAALQKSSSETLTRAERRRLRKLKRKESKGGKLDEESEARRQRRRERRKARREKESAGDGEGWMTADKPSSDAAIPKPADGNKTEEPTETPTWFYNATPTPEEDEGEDDAWFYGSKSRAQEATSSTRVGPSALSKEERRRRRKEKKGLADQVPVEMSKEERRRRRKEKRALRNAEAVQSPTSDVDEAAARAERRRLRKEKRAQRDAAALTSPTEDVDDTLSRAERRRLRKEKRAERDAAALTSPTEDVDDTPSRAERRRLRKEKRAQRDAEIVSGTPVSPSEDTPSRAERRRQRKEKRALRDVEVAGGTPVSPTSDADEAAARAERRRKRKEKRALRDAEVVGTPISPTSDAADVDEAAERAERRRKRKEKRGLRDAEVAGTPISPTVDLDEAASRAERRRQRKEKRSRRREDSSGLTLASTSVEEESSSRAERRAERAQKRKSRRARGESVAAPMVKEESGMVNLKTENVEHVRAGPGGRAQRKAKKKRSRRSRSTTSDTPTIVVDDESHGASVLKI